MKRIRKIFVFFLFFAKTPTFTNLFMGFGGIFDEEFLQREQNLSVVFMWLGYLLLDGTKWYSSGAGAGRGLTGPSLDSPRTANSDYTFLFGKTF